MVFRRIFERFGLGGNSNRLLIDRLHTQIVMAARQAGFYIEYGVRDEFDGRFELFCLLCSLVLRRLSQLPAPGPDVAQDLTDAIFRHLDIVLRQEGIGDVAVPKRLKKYAKAFAGRNAAYRAALQNGDLDTLRESLNRNFTAVNAPQLPIHFADDRMLRYILATEAAFGEQDLVVFTDGNVPFPDPAHVESNQP